jgi:hypothetical protein
MSTFCTMSKNGRISSDPGEASLVFAESFHQAFFVGTDDPYRHRPSTKAENDHYDENIGFHDLLSFPD